MLGAAITPGDSPECAAFLAVQIETTDGLLRNLMPQDKRKWTEFWSKEWLSSVGTLEIVDSPLGSRLLHLDQLDPGFVEYNPAVQDLAVRLIAAIKVKLQVTHKIHLEQHLASSVKLEQTRLRVKQVCNQVGLTRELDMARCGLSKWYLALCRLQ
ncbi:hypothetical protein JCM3774_001122, partial [Rhodotorula dairenensis]